MSLHHKLLEALESSGYEVSVEMQHALSRVEHIALSQDESDIEPVLAWLQEKQAACTVQVEEIGVHELEDWIIDEQTRNISHVSGKFFSILGVRVTQAGEREVSTWSQPMLKQEECGISGLIYQQKNGIGRYLFYAKFEPGNINLVQLSPALQVTASNLIQAHKGTKPRLAEYFEDGSKKGNVLQRVVGVEDGGRFYKKTNMSIIVEVPESDEIEITENYIWLTVPQIQKLLRIDHVMNSLARNVCALI
jgi:oxidase EvaA